MSARAITIMPACFITLAAIGCLALAPAADAAGLGALLTTKDGGQIFGFDIDQDGNDGVLASATLDDSTRVAVVLFDQDSGKITGTFAQHSGGHDEYVVDGIFAGDVALVTHEVTPDGSIYAKRKYQVMNPVTGAKFTGAWTPPLNDIDVLQASTDQASQTAAMLAIELKKQDKPVLIASDVASNSFTKVIHLDDDLFGLANDPVLSLFSARNEAVIALSPDGGRPRGKPPLNVLVDLSTGKQTSFDGFNFGFYGAGTVNGLAVDPVTGIGATTTELNAQVEFYDMGKRKRITIAQLPCTDATSQLNSGEGVAVDPVNKLFLVMEPNYCDGSEGGAIIVYDEAGNLVEQITGFKFAIGEPAPRLNPRKRMGWAYGGPGGFSQLQQFFY